MKQQICLRGYTFCLFIVVSKKPPRLPSQFVTLGKQFKTRVLGLQRQFRNSKLNLKTFRVNFKSHFLLSFYFPNALINVTLKNVGAFNPS